jgi:hypothetical protein
MKYVVINNACDGRHVHTYSTLQKAQKRMKNMIGKRETPFLPNISYISDWGNVLIIEERPDNWTSATENKIADAYDARECGTATKSQLRLLESKGF